MNKNVKKYFTRLFKYIIAIFIFTLSAIYITYPLAPHIADRVTGFGDELVISWIQNWVIHSLFTDPLNIFNANIYYPYNNTLAFSDPFILTGIMAIPIKFITGEAISVFNFTLISSLLLLGFSIFTLIYYLTKNYLLSVFCGLLINFSPAVLDYSVHVQVLAVWSVPLSTLFFLRFLETAKTRFLAVSLIILLIQIYNSVLPGYFIVFSFCVILLFYFSKKSASYNRFINLKNILTIALFAFAIIPIGNAYFSVSKEFNYVRDIRDAVHFAFQPEDFLFPGVRTKLHGFLYEAIPSNKFSQNNEFKPGYLGLIFSALVILAILYIIKNFKRISIDIKTFFTISMLGFILSLGPVLHLGRQTIHEPFMIPLPYALFYYIIPGFQGLRNSGRWNMLFMIAVVIVIGLILNKLLSRLSLKKQIIIYASLLFLVISELSPITLYPVTQKKDFPPVYSWLNTTPRDTVIIELPIYNWNNERFTGREIWRQYYGTEHFRRTSNGYTGFSPPPWQKFVTRTTLNFPDNKTLNELKSMGINIIIVHKKEFDAISKSNIFADQKTRPGSEVVTLLNNSKSVKHLKYFPDTNTHVYKLL